MDLLIGYKRCKIKCTTVSILVLVLIDIIAYFKTKDFRHKIKLWVLVWKIAKVLLWQKMGRGECTLADKLRGRYFTFPPTFVTLMKFAFFLEKKLSFLAAFHTWKQVWNQLFFYRQEMKFIMWGKGLINCPVLYWNSCLYGTPQCRCRN